ncbi:transposase [Paenibacillus sp. V4I3]|uniref:helix-turn-helix domain-containing protein n=1 Tax=Paenibacillus sp. V4I3 TaxID=3042305 RepID=UPI00278B2277|nr:helix-turn-helix domain-containing protein [Paenibacillus sp. V4I3]MDQ0875840.1 transposase [Paenibacillus sp. V4I3]
MVNGKYCASKKLAILEQIKSGEIGFNAAVKKYGINKTTLMKWRRRYNINGYEGLEIRTHNRSYSAELKLQAVMDYLDGKLSKYQIIDKYKIASTTQLSNWIKKYNGHSSLKAYKGEATAMTKSRTTTWQERIDMVQYCLAHQHNYQKTANHFQVSYQQVYQWVKKLALDNDPEKSSTGKGLIIFGLLMIVLGVILFSILS